MAKTIRGRSSVLVLVASAGPQSLERAPRRGCCSIRVMASRCVALLVATAAACDAAAVQTTSSFRSQFVSLSGVKHHIRDTGEVSSDGPVALLFHGFAGSAASWEEVAPLLAAGGVRAIAIDRVGFGRTERPKSPTMPAPASVPGGGLLAEGLEALVGGGEEGILSDGLLPEARAALAMGLRRPSALAPRLPWALSPYGEDPYSSRFAVSRAVWPLILRKVPPGRAVFLVGHSAGGAVALRAAAAAAAEDARSPARIAGVALVAPAALDPREDPDAYERNGDLPPLLDFLPDALPEALRDRAELEARYAAFRTLLALPDAFGLPTARRIADGRDINEAVLGQMHERMRAPEFAADVARFAKKYEDPVLEFPDDWDSALLNVYRADQEDDSPSGRTLIAAAKGAVENFLVVTGDSDRVVPVRSSRKVADLLGTGLVELAETGHLPMDECPDDLAASLLDFFHGVRET